MRKLFIFLLMLVAMAMGGMAWYAYTPMRTGADYPVAFSVPQGASFKMAAREMDHAGALQHAILFELLARALGKAHAIKAGSYALMEPATPLALLRKITVGETVLGKLTVIEGWSFAEMRRALDAQADLRHDSAGMSEAELLQAIGAQAGHPEGQFFPDTYFFDHGSSDLALYKRAYHTMQTVLAESWERRAPGLPYKTPMDALIMASIIEKETGLAAERREIAGVFVRRLQQGMRLQTDPTVIYGLGEHYDGNLRRVDLERDSPYNTYVRSGLPPTPICSPGAASIEASLHPSPGNALYFVARGDGSHVFSATLDAHNAAVREHQLRRR